MEAAPVLLSDAFSTANRIHFSGKCSNDNRAAVLLRRNQMTATKSFTGGCHCGKVRYEAKAGLEQVISCNCSICSKRGLLLTFVPDGQFTLLSGEEELTDYRFNKKNIRHLFCRSCGVESFATGNAPNGAKMAAVNVRCLDDVDLASLTLTQVDGKSF
jgi:hypothetical protein